MNSLERLIASGGNSDYFEAAIHPLMSKHKIYYEDISATADHFAQAIHNANVPAGLINIICGYGNEAGSMVTGHKDVSQVLVIILLKFISIKS